MDRRDLYDAHPAAIVALLAVGGVQLFREDSAVKKLLRRRYGVLKGGALYAALLAAGAAGWWLIWKEVSRRTLAPRVQEALRSFHTWEPAGV